MLTVIALFVLLAFLLSIGALIGRVPAAVPVFLLSVVELLRVWPR